MAVAGEVVDTVEDGEVDTEEVGEVVDTAADGEVDTVEDMEVDGEAKKFCDNNMKMNSVIQKLKMEKNSKSLFI